MITTIKDLLKEHPDWENLPLTIYREDGTLDWVGGAGSVYKSETCLKECEGDCEACKDGELVDVLVFSPN